MKKEEAIQIIQQVCADFRGNLQDHQKIQDALRVLTKPEPATKNPKE